MHSVTSNWASHLARMCRRVTPITRALEVMVTSRTMYALAVCARRMRSLCTMLRNCPIMHRPAADSTSDSLLLLAPNGSDSRDETNCYTQYRLSGISHKQHRSKNLTRHICEMERASSQLQQCIFKCHLGHDLAGKMHPITSKSASGTGVAMGRGGSPGLGVSGD